MKNNIIAIKKDGTKEIIGFNKDGYKPIFYRFDDLPCGRRLNSDAMFNWLIYHCSGIILGSYGLTDEKEDCLDPTQFKELMTSPVWLAKPSQLEIGLHPVLRHYGGAKKSAYTFNSGVYSDQNHIDWTFRPVGYFTA